jgi:hypothetical protein
MDEVHFQQYGSRCRMWVPPETKDPVLLHHPGRKSVGYFGAVRLRDGKFAHRRKEDKFNAETFFVFLNYLQRITAPSPRIDNTKYHHAKLHKEWRKDFSGVSPPIQPGSQSNRKCLEAHAAAGHSQQIFPYIE